MDKIALFDMDGTLYDYDSAIRSALWDIAGPGEPDYTDPEVPIWDEPHLQNRMRLIKNQPGFWRDLPKLKIGWDVLILARLLEFGIHILTKGPRDNPNAWAEKVQAIRRDFGTDQPDSIHITENKSVVYGRVLVDDWPDYIEGWLAQRPRGTVIMPVHPHNASFQHPQVIPCTGNNLHEVGKALELAYDR